MALLLAIAGVKTRRWAPKDDSTTAAPSKPSMRISSGGDGGNFKGAPVSTSVGGLKDPEDDINWTVDTVGEIRFKNKKELR